MTIKQQFRTRWLSFLKHKFNRFAMLSAGSRYSPFSIIHHVGRRSGKPYQTPVILQPIEDGFVLALTYGPDVDWFRNIEAAGGCKVTWHGKEYVIDKLEPLDTEAGRSAFPLLLQPILRINGVKNFRKMKFKA